MELIIFVYRIDFFFNNYRLHILAIDGLKSKTKNNSFLGIIWNHLFGLI